MAAMDELVAILDKAIDSGRVNVSELAATVGCSRQTIYNILNGDHVASLPLAEKLANAVGVTVRFGSPKKITASVSK